MNLKIKFRESFRPFAPSILAEDVEQYFDIKGISPYMLLTCPVRQEQEVKMAAGAEGSWISNRLNAVGGQIPAVTHVDNSARVHTVEKKVNPAFHGLLSKFKEKAGSPVLINTSFNVRGEPIVCTPNDAIRCFLRTNMDVLAIGPFIVQRNDQDQAMIEKIRKEDAFELD